MLLGAQLGFAPMVEGILSHLGKKCKTHGKEPKIILAGGASHHLDLPRCENRPAYFKSCLGFCPKQRNCLRSIHVVEAKPLPIVEVLNLAKKYGAIQALKGISFSIGKGEIVGFLGPNGAGKAPPRAFFQVDPG